MDVPLRPREEPVPAKAWGRLFAGTTVVEIIRKYNNDDF